MRGCVLEEPPGYRDHAATFLIKGTVMRAFLSCLKYFMFWDRILKDGTKTWFSELYTVSQRKLHSTVKVEATG